MPVEGIVEGLKDITGIEIVVERPVFLYGKRGEYRAIYDKWNQYLQVVAGEFRSSFHMVDEHTLFDRECQIPGLVKIVKCYNPLMLHQYRTNTVQLYDVVLPGAIEAVMV